MPSLDDGSVLGLMVLTVTAAQLGWSVTRGFNEAMKPKDWTADKLMTISEQIDMDDPFCQVLDCMWTGGGPDPGTPQRAEVLNEGRPSSPTLPSLC